MALLLMIAVAPAAAEFNSVKAAFKSNQALFRPMFVLIGDSITEYGFEAPHGWALQLSSKYARRADIINRGFGGALERFISVKKNFSSCTQPSAYSHMPKTALAASCTVDQHMAAFPDFCHADAYPPMRPAHSYTFKLHASGLVRTHQYRPPPLPHPLHVPRTVFNLCVSTQATTPAWPCTCLMSF